jgi:molybdenum cofactor cytidylyltransferase
MYVIGLASVSMVDDDDGGGGGGVGVGAVVLAAGGGSRYRAGDKLLVPFRGRPLVAWALDAALAAGLPATAVVAGHTDLGAVVPAGVDVIAHPRWSEGQATSLAAALAWARGKDLAAVVVGLGDQPLVTAAAWRAVAAADAPIAVATYGGRRGNPVRLARSVWSDLPTTGDEGARALFRRRPELVVGVPCPGSAEDVDTEDDLRRLGGAPMG